MKTLLSVAFAFVGLTACASWTFDKTANTITSDTGIVLNVNRNDGSIQSVKTLNGQTVLDLSDATNFPVTAVIFWNVKMLSNNALTGQSTLTEIKFPATLTSIGTESLKGCSGLTRLDFSKTALSTTGHSVFTGTRLEEVLLTDTMTKLDRDLFNGVSTLTNVEPRVFSKLSTLGANIFKGTQVTGSLTLSCSGLTSIPDNAFNGTQFSEVDISQSGVRTIGSSAFASMPNLVAVKLPDSLKTSGSSSFASGSLTTVEPFLPTNVSSIGGSAFGYSSVEGDLVFASKVVEFATPQNAFRSTKISSVDFFATTNTIALPNYAFYECKNLRKVVFGRGKVTCSSQVFRNCPLEEIWFAGPPPTGLTYSGFHNGSWTALSAKIYVPKGNADWDAFLSTNTNVSVSWVTANLTAAEKASFVEKWPDEKVPSKKVCIKGGSPYYQYLCKWYPDGNPGLTIILR